MAKLVPLRVSYGIAEAVSCVYYVFARCDRENVKKNLKVVLGEDFDDKLLEEYTFNVFKNFAKYLADFFKITKFKKDYISRNVDLNGRVYLDETLSKRKGVILLTFHMGNWEGGGAILGALGYPITVIALKHTDKKINDFFVRQRAINNLKVIHLGEAQIKECFRLLKRNEILGILADKNYTTHGFYADFFGKKALIPKGPAVISLKTGAPVVVCVISRQKDDTIRMNFSPPIWPETTGSYDKDLENLIGRYLRIFEREIKKTPDQWYVFKKIWD